MMVIGVDPHKQSHTAVAADELGRKKAQKTVRARRDGHRELIAWARRDRPGGRLWAVEDVRHVAGGLIRELLAAGEQVVFVPPWPLNILGLGDRVTGQQPGPHGGRDLRRGAGSCQGERGALGERGELRGEGPEGLRQGRGHDDEVRVPRVDRPGQLRERGVHPEIVDPPSAAVQDDAEDRQRQVVKLPWGAGQDGAGAVPVPPAPGRPASRPRMTLVAKCSWATLAVPAPSAPRVR